MCVVGVCVVYIFVYVCGGVYVWYVFMGVCVCMLWVCVGVCSRYMCGVGLWVYVQFWFV